MRILIRYRIYLILLTSSNRYRFVHLPINLFIIIVVIYAYLIKLKRNGQSSIDVKLLVEKKYKNGDKRETLQNIKEKQGSCARAHSAFA